MSQSIGTLWTISMQPAGQTIRSAVALAGLSVDIPGDYIHFEDNLKPEFLSKFPHGKIPAFESKDGSFKVFESTAILRYVAALAPNSGLLGGDAKEAALVDQWMHFAETEISAFTQTIRIMLGNTKMYNKGTHNNLVDRQARALATLEKYLSTHTYLVGERITLADLVVASAVSHAAKFTFDAAARSKKPSVVRHLETIVNHPRLVEIFGPTEFVEKAVQFVPPPKEKKEATPA